MLSYRQSRGPGEGLVLVGRNVRAPLHKMISCAELLSEENRSSTSPGIVCEVARFLSLCEAALRHAQNLPEHHDLTEGASFDRLKSTLLQSCVEIQQAAATLANLAAGETGAELRSDVDRLCHYAAIFRDTLQSLPHPALSDQTGSPSRESDPRLPAPSAQDTFARAALQSLILVVDDDEGNRDILSRRLLRDGYEVMLAENGRQALRMLNRYSFDAVLLDIMMPEMDGMAVLASLKIHPLLNTLPVIMITAVDEIETIAQCIESGADDYLLKPFNPVLLRARINALLERKRLQDEQTRQRKELEVILNESREQKEKAELLLRNILPAVVADELRDSGEVRPMYFEDATITFADIVGFTASSEQMPADELVELLHKHFTACDKIVSRYGLEKLKTIGDCYMFAGGLPVRTPSHPVDSVLAAAEMITAMADLRMENQVNWQLRIGINTGPVIAGVVGIHKFAFDIWGDTVNYASRIESCGSLGRINLSHSTFARVKDFFAFEKRERVQLKGDKELDMYLIHGIAPGLLNKPNQTILEAFHTRYATFFRKKLLHVPASMFPP